MRPGAFTSFKRRVKAALGALVFESGIHRLLCRKRALIVLFHRVDDRYPENDISCTTRAFEAYCRFFRRHFVVVGLAELVEKVRRGEDVSRHLAITFDDGYLDNRTNAAPVLERLGLPACFFIATELIGSRRVPWWDRADDIVSEWMDWDDVRSLRAARFEIGAHTLNHVNLGLLEGAAAEHEIVESGRRLMAELGTDVVAFSYPYGRADQITEANRDVVRRSGYRCCLSAFGGTVKPDDDPFRLRRMPVSPWYRSPYQFGWEALFARS